MKNTLRKIVEVILNMGCNQCKHNTLFGFCDHPADECCNSILPKYFERKRKRTRG